MYSTLLLEDAAFDVKSMLSLSNSTSMFVTGILIGLQPSNKIDSIGALGSATGSAVGTAGTHIALSRLEKKFRSTLNPIINKFALPADKALEMLKKGSFVKPKSKFFNIILYTLSFLFLLLGFTVVKLVLLYLGKEQKAEVFKQYKKFLLTILFAFAVAIIVTSFITFIVKVVSVRLDLNKDYTKDKVLQAVVKAYKLVAAKYPEFAKVPLYYVKFPSAMPNAFASLPLANRNILIVPSDYSSNLTDNELVAIYLHEIGHLLNITSMSTLTILISNVMNIIMRFFTRVSKSQILAGISSDILDRFLASVAAFNREIIADTFAASMGYGKYLITGLEKLINGFSSYEDDFMGFAAHFLTHPDLDKRREYIIHIMKHYTDDAFHKTTSILKRYTDDASHK
jgi:Zn-dependent protease with chaperone function